MINGLSSLRSGAPGDKIMQIENDYDKEVYNGDIGFIDDVDPDLGELTVSFDGRAVDYGFGELDGFRADSPYSGSYPAAAK